MIPRSLSPPVLFGLGALLWEGHDVLAPVLLYSWGHAGHWPGSLKESTKDQYRIQCNGMTYCGLHTTSHNLRWDIQFNPLLATHMDWVKTWFCFTKWRWRESPWNPKPAPEGSQTHSASSGLYPHQSSCWNASDSRTCSKPWVLARKKQSWKTSASIFAHEISDRLPGTLKAVTPIRRSTCLSGVSRDLTVESHNNKAWSVLFVLVCVGFYWQRVEHLKHQCQCRIPPPRPKLIKHMLQVGCSGQFWSQYQSQWQKT